MPNLQVPLVYSGRCRPGHASLPMCVSSHASGNLQCQPSCRLVSTYCYQCPFIGLVGPDWKGETPAGIRKVFQSTTPFGLTIFRTQLFNAEDMPNVVKVQAGYKAQPLSAFLKQPAPPAAAKIDFLPATTKGIKENFYAYSCASIGRRQKHRPSSRLAQVAGVHRASCSRSEIATGDNRKPDQRDG
jgi:hypothetical protein